jgi:hypothetical protein
MFDVCAMLWDPTSQQSMSREMIATQNSLSVRKRTYLDTAGTSKISEFNTSSTIDKNICSLDIPNGFYE